MEYFHKQIKDRRQGLEPKTYTVFCIEVRSQTESKEPSVIQQYKNVTKSVIYILFYNKIVASGYHQFLEHVIQCCVTEMHDFLEYDC